MSLGIENLKKAATLAIRFGQQIETAAEGGFKLADLFGFIDEFSAIPEVVNNKQAIVDEFKDLDSTERAELVSYVEQTLDLKNDRLEGIIEAGLELVLAILVLVDKLKKPSEEPQS